MATTTVAAFIAAALLAAENCARSGNTEWREKHELAADRAVARFLPSGSGWDRGTTLDNLHSTPEKLVFRGSFHHMDEHGGYDGWTDHIVTVRASLWNRFSISISGHNRNGVKDLLRENFAVALAQECDSAEAYED